MHKSRGSILFNTIVTCLIAIIATVSVIIIVIGIIFSPAYCDIIEENANDFSIDKVYIYAIVKAESGYDASSVSPRGALGLMQLMPDTARWIFEELNYADNGLPDFNAFVMRPEINILLATGYLRYLVDKFDSIKLAVIAYNAGEGRLNKWLADGLRMPRDIPFSETKNYYNRVMTYANIYRMIT